ncbi:MAG: ABC transporter ATP-binding protein [Acidimicrobiia bacterium]|nr:ABC transporter ATP-binding protein [Acidimicrobiia bacterium]
MSDGQYSGVTDTTYGSETSRPDGEVLLSIRNLRTRFVTEDGDVPAVNGVSFEVRRGEVLSVVGESGSGKSVTAMSILGLLPSTARIEADHMLWRGESLLNAGENRMRQVRGGEIAMIFQDPLSALNPVHKVGRQIAEMILIHESVSKKEAESRAVDMLDLVGIPQAASRAGMYPHEFSGGMRQRAMIAMAIACSPDLLIADEPTTALDVTVQAQVLEVLLRLKDELNSAILLITHDLGVVAGISDRVMVMYAGRQAEVGSTDQVFYRTRHPYTLGLMRSLPRLDDVGSEPLMPITGAPPSLLRLPTGCAFHPRCPLAGERCSKDVPDLNSGGLGHHPSACFYADEVSGDSAGLAGGRA